MKKLHYLLPLIFLVACQSIEMPEELPTPTEKPTQVQLVENDVTPAPEPEINPLVELAIQDLATRLNLDPELVTVIDIKPVTWPDSSLGCPQEGMMYAQVETDGYLIHVLADSQLYEYHTDTSQFFILCESSNLPTFPITPGEIDDGKPWMPVD